MRSFGGNTAGGLAVVCVAQFVVVLDVTIVATALPAIGADLDAPATQLSWVLTAYTVVLAGLLILGGRPTWPAHGGCSSPGWPCSCSPRRPARWPGRPPR
jgi:MFS family permease